MINKYYQTLSGLVDARKSEFSSSDKSKLGIFWLDDDLSRIIHSKTLLEEDIEKNNPAKYSFTHYTEWDNRPSPQSYPGAYNDYPRGRIFYQEGHYVVEIDIHIPPRVESYIRSYFLLPIETEFKSGYW
jgi:hypothetical protein